MVSLSNNPDGRPVKFKTVKQIQKKIDAYFRKCDKKLKPYTVSGLALELGLSRQGLINYGDKDLFVDTIRKAKAKCEAFAEERLYINSSTSGVSFALQNNFGWKNKTEQDVNLNGNLNVNNRQEYIKKMKEKAQNNDAKT